MTNSEIVDGLRAIIVELDHVRRGIMEDAPRRATFEWANRALIDAKRLLANLESEVGEFRQAAE